MLAINKPTQIFTRISGVHFPSTMVPSTTRPLNISLHEKSTKEYDFKVIFELLKADPKDGYRKDKHPYKINTNVLIFGKLKCLSQRLAFELCTIQDMHTLIPCFNCVKAYSTFGLSWNNRSIQSYIHAGSPPKSQLVK